LAKHRSSQGKKLNQKKDPNQENMQINDTLAAHVHVCGAWVFQPQQIKWVSKKHDIAIGDQPLNCFDDVLLSI
jgi:hypothetical protein